MVSENETVSIISAPILSINKEKLEKVNISLEKYRYVNKIISPC